MEVTYTDSLKLLGMLMKYLHVSSGNSFTNYKLNGATIISQLLKQSWKDLHHFQFHILHYITL